MPCVLFRCVLRCVANLSPPPALGRSCSPPYGCSTGNCGRQNHADFERHHRRSAAARRPPVAAHPRRAISRALWQYPHDRRARDAADHPRIPDLRHGRRRSAWPAHVDRAPATDVLGRRARRKGTGLRKRTMVPRPIRGPMRAKLRNWRSIRSRAARGDRRGMRRDAVRCHGRACPAIPQAGEHYACQDTPGGTSRHLAGMAGTTSPAMTNSEYPLTPSSR